MSNLKTKEQMREQIIIWYRNNNNHPLDDNRLYDIVINSIDNKIERETFEEALRECNEQIMDNEIDDVYTKYESLRNFLVYYIKRH